MKNTEKPGFLRSCLLGKSLAQLLFSGLPLNCSPSPEGEKQRITTSFERKKILYGIFYSPTCFALYLLPGDKTHTNQIVNSLPCFSQGKKWVNKNKINSPELQYCNLLTITGVAFRLAFTNGINALGIISKLIPQSKVGPQANFKSRLIKKHYP